MSLASRVIRSSRRVDDCGPEDSGSGSASSFSDGETSRRGSRPVEVFADEVPAPSSRSTRLEVGHGRVGADDEARHRQCEPCTVVAARLRLCLLPGREPVADGVGASVSAWTTSRSGFLQAASSRAGEPSASARSDSARSLSAAACASSPRSWSRIATSSSAGISRVGNVRSRVMTSWNCWPCRRTSISSFCCSASS